MKKLILLLLLVPILSMSQSLGKMRVDRLNKSVVKILIDGNKAGTGFFVSKDGILVTCRHVIASSIITDSTGIQILGYKPIKAQFRNGEIVELDFFLRLIDEQKWFDDANIFDYYLLKARKTTTTDIIPLRLGSWKDVQEGDMVYTSGYPLNVNQPTISQGILSTKYTLENTLTKRSTGEITRSYKREQAWLDLTLNRGNSGGPIIKMGKGPDDDVVIGLASFILNPYGNEASIVAKDLKENDTGRKNQWAVTKRALQFLFEAISNNSIGVSGAISIDYLLNYLRSAGMIR